MKFMSSTDGKDLTDQRFSPKRGEYTSGAVKVRFTVEGDMEVENLVAGLKDGTIQSIPKLLPKPFPHMPNQWEFIVEFPTMDRALQAYEEFGWETEDEVIR